jgi:hypothetical protein
MLSTAWAKTSPVDLWRLLSTPTPSGLVSVSGRPAAAASLRSSRAGSTSPVTAMPYFGSGSSMLWPAGDRAGRLAGDVEAAAQHLGEQLGRQRRPRPADEVHGDDRPAAHGVDVRQGVGRGDAAPVVRAVHDGVKKSAVATTAVCSSTRTTAASSPSSSPTSRSGEACPVRPRTTSSSSPGGILQAQPPAGGVLRQAVGRHRLTVRA